jgi:segregation and condensation protein A
MNSAPYTPSDRPGLCRIRLEAFQGPLDLLLHLVRIEEIDVTTVSINEIARQCDDYLRLITDLDLEAAGENLVLASTLLHLKSRRLLPPTASEGDAAGDAASFGPEDDPGWRDGMRRVAEELQEREAQMELVFTRPPDRVAEFAGEELIEADLYSLLNAFQSILKRLGSETPAARITRERMTLVERIDWLLERLNREQRIGFRDLFDDIADRMSCILTFLALLEVMRLRLVRAYESHHQDDILIILVEDTVAPPAAEAQEGSADA